MSDDINEKLDSALARLKTAHAVYVQAEDDERQANREHSRCRNRLTDARTELKAAREALTQLLPKEGA